MKLTRVPAPPRLRDMNRKNKKGENIFLKKADRFLAALPKIVSELEVLEKNATPPAAAGKPSSEQTK